MSNTTHRDFQWSTNWGGRRREVVTLTQTDFTGGLNLLADAFQLAENEIMDVQNMDLDARGGFFQRDSISSYNASLLPDVPANLWPYVSASGTSSIVVQQGSDIAYSATGKFTRVSPDALVTTGIMNASEMKDVLYIQRNAERVPFKWDGSTATALASAFQEDFAAPTGGNMPTAKLVTSWMGYMWVANTDESGTSHGSRLRFSHPNFPEDWRSLDYFDVDIGRDGDEITALMPLGDRMLVFKNRSTHIVAGYDASTFSTYEVSRTVGTISQQSVTQSEYGVFTFSWPDGLFRITSEKDHPQWQFERLRNVVSNINPAAQKKITVDYLQRRVWVGIPESPAIINTKTYVLDPTVARPRSGIEGAWTVYNKGFGPAMEWRTTGGAITYLACCNDAARVCVLHGNASVDEWYTSEMVLDGVAGSYAWTADTAGLSVTGDLEIQGWVKPTDWTPTGVNTILSKWEETGNQRSYALSLDAAGKLELRWSPDGTAVITKISTVVTGLTDATWKMVKATLDVDNGAAGNDVKFWLSDDGLTWVQLGSTVTTAGTTSVYDGTARLTVGAALDDGSTRRLTGSVRWVKILDGIDGTEVGNADFTAITYGNTSFTDEYTQVWAIEGGATLTQDDPEIYSYLTTRWIDHGTPQVVKRWKRPEVVLEGGTTRNIRVDLWRDYDPSSIKRTLFLTTAPDTGVLVWDVGSWDDTESLWGSDDGTVQEINRIGALGRARAVRLKFTKQNTGSDWGISALMLKYLPKRVRG